MEDARLLIAAIKDYRSGAYRQFPYAVIAAAVFALLYVFNPFDLMPDYRSGAYRQYAASDRPTR
jgi:uncharacterized membrane protein YkvA (DUF1232 family)